MKALLLIISLRAAVAAIVLLMTVAGMLQPSRAYADDGEAFTLQLSAIPQKGHPKLDSALDALVRGTAASQPHQRPGARSFSMQDAQPVPEEPVRVIVESMPGRTGEVASLVAGYGTVEGDYGDMVQLLVTPSRLTALAEHEQVAFIRQPMVPFPAFTSEGLPVVNANEWQSTGYDGAHVKVGILDSGFGGYTIRRSQGELPASLETSWEAGRARVKPSWNGVR